MDGHMGGWVDKYMKPDQWIDRGTDERTDRRADLERDETGHKF